MDGVELLGAVTGSAVGYKEGPAELDCPVARGTHSSLVPLQCFLLIWLHLLSNHPGLTGKNKLAYVWCGKSETNSIALVADLFCQI